MSAGAAFVFLNILRIISILSLICASTASILVIILEVRYFGTYFFSILSHAARIVACLILIASEMPLPRTTKALQRKIPALTYGHSLAYAGWAMLVLSVGLLSEQNSSLVQEKGLGQAVQIVILAAGTMTGVVGIVYAVLPIIYWRSPAGECRRARKDGAVGAPTTTPAEAVDPRPMSISRPIVGSESGGSVYSNKFPTFAEYAQRKNGSW